MAGPFTLRKSGGGSSLRGDDTLRGEAAETVVVTHLAEIFAYPPAASGPPGTTQI